MRELLEVRVGQILARKQVKDLSGLCPFAGQVRDAVNADDVPGYLAADRRSRKAFIGAAGNVLLTVRQWGCGTKCGFMAFPRGLGGRVRWHWSRSTTRSSNVRQQATPGGLARDLNSILEPGSPFPSKRFRRQIGSEICFRSGNR
jgi:hypothetical protein